MLVEDTLGRNKQMVGRETGSHGDMIHSRVTNNDAFGMMATGKSEERTTSHCLWNPLLLLHWLVLQKFMMLNSTAFFRFPRRNVCVLLEKQVVGRHGACVPTLYTTKQDE